MYFTAVILKMTLWRLRRSTERSEKLLYVDRSLTCESRELRSGKFILTFDVTDFTDTITAKMFIRPEIFNEVKDMIKTGMFIKIKGVTTIDKFDGELTLGSIVGIKKADDFTTKRMDNSLEKRVELHCHTK